MEHERPFNRGRAHEGARPSVSVPSMEGYGPPRMGVGKARGGCASPRVRAAAIEIWLAGPGWRLFSTTRPAKDHYCRSLRTDCGAELACASIEVPACWRICSLVKFTISEAMSTSRIRLSDALRFS